MCQVLKAWLNHYCVKRYRVRLLDDEYPCTELNGQKDDSSRGMCAGIWVILTQEPP